MAASAHLEPVMLATSRQARSICLSGGGARGGDLFFWGGGGGGRGNKSNFENASKTHLSTIYVAMICYAVGRI